MTIDLYYLPASSPCRSVLLTANAVGVQLNLKFLDLFKGEHLTPEFLKVRNLTSITIVYNLQEESCFGINTDRVASAMTYFNSPLYIPEALSHSCTFFFLVIPGMAHYK